MRRIILLVLVGVLAFFGYVCVVNGVENSTFGIEIFKVEEIDEDSSKLSKELNAYEEKNEKQFKAVESGLNVALKNYENAKSEYQELIEILGVNNEEAQEEVIEATTKPYQIDFLFAIIGNYARAENNSEGDLDLDLVFVESTSASAPKNAGYIFADLKFTVKGSYVKIANFLYDLEDDDRLAYEIRDFTMTSGRATFTVYNVPIESTTLSGVGTSGAGSSMTENDLTGSLNSGNLPGSSSLPGLTNTTTTTTPGTTLNTTRTTTPSTTTPSTTNTVN